MFEILVIDPPTSFVAGKGRTNPANHYEVMTDKELLEFFQNIPKVFNLSDDCLIFLWFVDTKLPYMFKLMNALNSNYDLKKDRFKYVGSAFDWVKLNKNYVENSRKFLKEQIYEEHTDPIEYMEKMSFMNTGYYTRHNMERCYCLEKAFHQDPLLKMFEH